MAESNFPRLPGSNTIVHENDWNQSHDVPLGHCPACGSIGIEELSVPGDKDICFYCSDETCQTIMGTRTPARTKWNRDKPLEMQQKEMEGWSWNAEHFPGQEMPEASPD